MLFFFDENQQVTRYTVVLSGITFTVDGNLHAFGYTGRNLDADYFFTVYDAFATAFLTFVFDDFTFTAALRTNGLSLHHTEDALLGACNASCSVTGRTSFYTAVAFGSRTMAM